MTLKRTHRGFAVYGELYDTYGALISVVESSADPLVHGWLFIKGGAGAGGAHLTVNQARRLVTLLQRFIDDKGAVPSKGRGAGTPRRGQVGGP